MKLLALLLALLALPIHAAEKRAPESFRFDPSTSKISVWGKGNEFPRTYFKELLPALFERTLVFRRFEPGEGALEWIFTGERAGFTVRIDAATVRVTQRFYDSFGLNPLEGGEVRPARHPERQWLESTAAYQRPLRTVTVALDHRLELSVSLNGQEAIRQTCLFDARRHQLSYVGKLGRVEGSLDRPDIENVNVRVDAARRHQTMLGFGGITSAMAYRQLSEEGKRRWWELLCQYNLLLHREYPIGARLTPAMDNWDRFEDATPHYYGDNFPNGEISDFEYLKTFRRIGGKVVFEFWELPPWARRPDGAADAAPYAHAIIRYCQISRDRAGSPPDIVGIQNERSQAPKVWHEMTLWLRRELDAAGFHSVQLHMPDAPTLAAGIRSARAFRNSERVWKAIDFAASHVYDYQKFLSNPDGYDALLTEWNRAVAGKPFLSTEISVNQAPYQVASYRLALGMGQLYHKNLTLADASALLYCWLLLNVEQPSYGWTRSLFVPDPAHGFMPAPSSYQLRVFGAYSRRIREGMTRLETTTSDPDLLATAFEASNGDRTMVLLNRSRRPQRIRVDWEGKPFRFLENTDPHHENSVQPVSGTTILLEPGAIATLSTAELRALPLG